MADEPIGSIPSGTAEPGASAAPQQSMDDFVGSRNHQQFGVDWKPSAPQTAQPESVPGSEPPAGEKPAEPPAASPESAPGTEPPAEATPETPEEPGSEPEKGDKAVKELKAQRQKRQELERENAYLKGLMEGRGMVAPGQPDAPQPPAAAAPLQAPVKPAIEQFETYEQFETALYKWQDDMVDFRTAEIERRVTQNVTQKTAVDTVHQTFVQRLAEAEKTNPAIGDAYNEVGKAINQPMAQFIKHSPQGPQVLLYLHEHMEETARLARTNPYLAVAELGQIAGKFAAVTTAAAPPAQPIQQSKAPPPVKPVVNNGAPVETPLDKLPIDDFMKERNEHQYGQRRR